MMEYKIGEHPLREVQLKQIEILLEFDRICRKYNIKYSLEGGTLLGAVKYQGFVPWDDDIDIIMLRDDYEKFLQVAKEDLGSKFFLQNTKSDRYYPLNYSKLRMNNTIYMQKNYEKLNIHQGLFIDIFPLDYVQKKNFRWKCSILGILNGARGKKLGIRQIQPKWKQFIYRIVSMLPLKTINKMIDAQFIKMNKKQSEFVFEMCSPILSHPFQNLSRYKEFTELIFEGHNFFVVKEYEQFLTERFGDYMHTEPDPLTRGPSHAIIKCKL